MSYNGERRKEGIKEGRKKLRKEGKGRVGTEGGREGKKERKKSFYFVHLLTSSPAPQKIGLLFFLVYS